jgi:hypothetical protein
MRKLVGVLAVVTAVGAIGVAPAAAQQPETTFTSKAQIFPKKAGTKANPQGIMIKGSLRFRTITPGFEPPIITGGDIFLPKYGKYNGGRYARCSAATLRRDGGAGLKYCPKKSIMGQGSGSALADTVDAKPKVVFVNGGASKILAYTTLYNPAFVQEPVTLNVKKIKHPKWGYKVSFKVPSILQVVAGVPIALQDLNYSIGGKSYAKEYITTTGCPKSKKYPYQGTAHYLYSDGTTSSKTYNSTVPCS